MDNLKLIFMFFWVALSGDASSVSVRLWKIQWVFNLQRFPGVCLICGWANNNNNNSWLLAFFYFHLERAWFRKHGHFALVLINSSVMTHRAWYKRIHTVPHDFWLLQNPRGHYLFPMSVQSDDFFCYKIVRKHILFITYWWSLCDL